MRGRNVWKRIMDLYFDHEYVVSIGHILGIEIGELESEADFKERVAQKYAEYIFPHGGVK